jgi:predicted phosphate transport protein (TIGR00153 family)
LTEVFAPHKIEPLSPGVLTRPGAASSLRGGPVRFLPRDDKYFALLNQLAAKVKSGGEIFVRVFDDFQNHEAYADQIKAIELECDSLSATITQKLNSSFITPIDREDIYLLTGELDDVIDMITDLARRMSIYGVVHPRADSREIAGLLGEATAEIETVFSRLEHREKFSESLLEIGNLEKRADTLYSEAIRRLFKDEKDPIEVIKWMSIYEGLENSIDRCKDVAEALEAVVVKNK